MSIDPFGELLYAADATSVRAFFIDSSSGALTAVSGSPFIGASNKLGSFAMAGAL